MDSRWTSSAGPVRSTVPVGTLPSRCSRRRSPAYLPIPNASRDSAVSEGEATCAIRESSQLTNPRSSGIATPRVRAARSAPTAMRSLDAMTAGRALISSDDRASASPPNSIEYAPDTCGGQTTLRAQGADEVEPATFVLERRRTHQLDHSVVTTPLEVFEDGARIVRLGPQDVHEVLRARVRPQHGERHSQRRELGRPGIIDLHVQQHRSVDSPLKGPGTEDVDLLGRTSLHEADQQLALPRRCRRFDPRRHRRIEGLPQALLRIPHHHESDVSTVPLPQSACPGVRGPADLSRMLLDPRTKSRPDARLAVERVAHRGGGDPQVTSDGGGRRVDLRAMGPSNTTVDGLPRQAA